MATLTDKQKLFKYFDITKDTITCKYSTYLEISVDDYKIDDEELLEFDDDQVDYSYNIPGIFEAFIPDMNDSVNFALPFEINLIKPENTLIKNGILTINYEAGDKLLFANTKSSASDLKIITKILDNQIKYLRGNISKTVEILWSQISSTSKIKFHHIELIYSVLYGQDTPQGFIPLRLGSQNYTREFALGSKESAQNFGSTNAFNYGYTNEAILKNVTRRPDLKPAKSDLEKIIAAEYHNLPVTDNQV